MAFESDGLAELGYTQRWIDYGILCTARLQQDVDDYRANGSLEYSAEHYRECALIDFIQSREHFTNDDIEHLFDLGSNDSDTTLLHTIVLELIQCDRLTDEQFDRLRGHPAVKQFEASRMFLRHELLRLLRRGVPDDAILMRCLLIGDSEVHCRLIELRPPLWVLDKLSDMGANKEVRHLAQAAMARHQKGQIP